MRAIGCLGMVVGIALLLGCGRSPLESSQGKDLRPDPATPVWLRLFSDAPEQLRGQLTREGLDITGSHHRLGFVDVIVARSEKDALLSRWAPLISRLELLGTLGSRADNLSLYHSPDEVSAYLDEIQSRYPTIARKVALGVPLFEGHVIYGLKISDHVEQDENEPVFLLDGQIHAREVMTAEIGLDAIDYLTSRYDTDPQVKAWVDGLEIWIVPVINPDGAAAVFQGNTFWRKNRNPTCAVDLNRNFSWNYGACSGATSACWAETYSGSGAASEPETQQLRTLYAKLRPIYYLHYHAYGEYILWPSGCKRVDDHDLFTLVGKELNNRVPNDSGKTGQWKIGPIAEAIYEAPGGSIDDAYGSFGVIALAFEINSTSFSPDYARYRDLTVQRQSMGWQYLLDRALSGPSIRGTVRDADTLLPLQATYELTNRPFTSGQLPLQTDAQGSFARAILPRSDLTVTFAAAGYRPQTSAVRVGQGAVDLDILLTKK